MSENQKSNKSIYLILIGLLLLTNVVCGYLLWNKKQQHTQLETDYTSLNTQKTELDVLYKETASSLDEQKGINTRLDSLISVRESEMTEKKSEIERLLKKSNLTASELSKAKTLINELKAQNQQVLLDVDNLKKEIGILKEENSALTTNLQTEKETTKNLTEAKSKLEESNKFLTTKYDIAALLQTNNMQAIGIKTKSNGKEVELNKISKMEKLRICYETGLNKVIEKGQVDHYIRIVGPNGTTITSTESGKIKMADGKETQYSKKISFDYAAVSKKLCIYWDGNNFSAGKHTVEVYQNGNQIGISNFELK